VGDGGCVLITTSADEGEVHPEAFLTVKVYLFVVRPVTNVVVPLPVVVTSPGERVRNQLPVEGKPLNATLPAAKAQVGCVMVPITGAVGVGG
jgi:hypothetical protein